MSKVVETRSYRDGDATLTAEVLDNGCVRFRASYPRSAKKAGAAVSAAVLEQLAELARKARAA